MAQTAADLKVTIRVDPSTVKEAQARVEASMEKWKANRALAPIFQQIATERKYQDERWGGPAHDDTHSGHDWVAYMVKYLGAWQVWPTFSIYDFRRSMVKVASLAVAAIEWADRVIAREGHQAKGEGEDDAQA